MAAVAIVMETTRTHPSSFTTCHCGVQYFANGMMGVCHIHTHTHTHKHTIRTVDEFNGCWKFGAPLFPSKYEFRGPLAAVLNKCGNKNFIKMKFMWDRRFLVSTLARTNELLTYI